MPKISVIMPIYNAEKYIKKAIYSILNQTYQDIELILIHDCSTDHSMDAVDKIKDKRIKIIQNKRNMGIAYSRNIGLEAARGEYIALMDDDDLAPLDRLQKEVNFLDGHRDIDVVGGRYCLIDEKDLMIEVLPEPLRNPNYIKASLLFFNPIGNGTAMFRKQFVMKNHITYQDGCLGMEDYRFWVDCSLHGKITNLNDIMLYWRQDNNETRKVLTYKKEERAACFKGIQRYALEKNGYWFTEEEYELLLEAYTEDYTKNFISIEKLERLYIILKRLIYQAEEKLFDNYLEIKILCRKLFARRLEFSELWR